MFNLLSKPKVSAMTLIIAAAIGGAAQASQLNVSAWNSSNLQNNPAFAAVQSSVVDLEVWCKDGKTKAYGGTGVLIKGTSLNGHLAILTIRHNADFQATKYDGDTVRVMSTTGQWIADAEPVITPDYPHHSGADFVVVLEITHVVAPVKLMAIAGATLAPVESAKDMYAYVDTPAGIYHGASGSGWFNAQGQLIGITSDCLTYPFITDHQASDNMEVTGTTYLHADTDDANGFDDGNGASSQISGFVPKQDFVLIASLDSDYLREVLPEAFIGVSFHADVNVAHPFTYGFVNWLNTYFTADGAVSDGTCMTEIAAVRGLNAQDIDTDQAEFQTLGRPECSSITTTLNAAAEKEDPRPLTGTAS
jgi:hypothetical protein